MNNRFYTLLTLCVLLAAASMSAQVTYNTFTTDFGNIQLGPANSLYANFNTDRTRFLFEKQVLIKTGKVGSYGTAQDLSLTTHLTTRATIKATNGSFGLNVLEPLAMMHVKNTTAAFPGLRVEQTMNNAAGLVLSLPQDSSRALLVQRSGVTNFQVMGDGRVFAREVEVKLGAFPDYVFDASHQMLSMAELKAYIAQHKHLPNMPSAQQVAENGIGMGELALKQVEKIEELTLYLIQMNERLERLEQENKELKAQIKEKKTKKKKK